MTKYKVQNNIQAQEFCENAVSIPLLILAVVKETTASEQGSYKLKRQSV